MSELRIPDATFKRTIARVQGKIQHGSCQKVTFEIYGAYQFKTKHRRIDGNFIPKVPIMLEDKKMYYETMSRLRINGVWHSPSGAKYEFFSQDQVKDIVFGFHICQP